MCDMCLSSLLAPGGLIACFLKKGSHTPRGLMTQSSDHCCWSHGLYHFSPDRAEQLTCVQVEWACEACFIVIHLMSESLPSASPVLAIEQ